MGAMLDILRGREVQLPGVRLDTGSPSGVTKVVYGTSSGRRIQLDQGENRYDRMAAAYRCVHAIATNMASIDLVVLGPDGAELPTHPVAQLWNRWPQPGMSARVQKEVLAARSELAGEAMLYLDRGPTGTGPITGMFPIFDPVEVIVDDRLDGSGAGELQGFVVKPRGRRPVGLLPSEVLWLRYPDPFSRWEPLAPWRAALYAAESDAWARAWQRGEFINGARPSHVVYLGDLEEADAKAAMADYRAQVEGAGNAGKSLLVAGPVRADATRLGLTPAEMSYLQSRTANADEVMLAFGVPRDYLLGGVTYENRAAAKTTLWSDTLGPKLEVWAGETDRQLLPDLGQTAAFDLTEVDALQENQDALVTRLVAATGSDLVLLDEARAQLGLDPLPGGAGQQTLSAYRAQLDQATAAAAALLAPPSAPTPQRVRILVTGTGLRRQPYVPARARALELLRSAPVAVPAGAEVRALPAAGRHTAIERPRVLDFYDRHEAIGQRAVARLARKQQRIVLRRLRDLLQRGGPELLEAWGREAEDVQLGASGWSELPVPRGLAEASAVRMSAADLFDPTYWTEQTREALEAFIAAVYEGGGAAAAEALGVVFSTFDQRVLNLMAARLDVLAARVTETTRQVIEGQLLQAGVEGGESVDRLAARITSVFTDLQGWRAQAIARTETVGGFNAASRVAAVESGVVTARRWLATRDERTRHSHAAINGETVQGLAGRYSNGLLHPGEPGAPAREVVNCRCVETYLVD